MITDTPVATTLDLRGRTITTYIAYELHRAFDPLDIGERIDVTTEAFEAIDTDLRAWCRAIGHRIVVADTTGDLWRFTIEKGASRASDRGFAAIVSDDGLFELLAPLGFALAAALQGHAVSLYFQGRAVRVLAPGFTARMHGLGRPFSRFPRAGLERAGHISPHDKLRQLRTLGARIYACGPSMDHFGVDPLDLVLDDVVVSEYLTFMEQMERADIHVFS